MRSNLKLVALLLITFIGLSACDLLGDDDDDASWGGLGPGALGDTLSINATVTREVNFDGTSQDELFVAYQHTPGRDYELFDARSFTILDTDTSDDAVLMLSTGVPDATLLDTPANVFGVGVTSTNTDARILEAEIESDTFDPVRFYHAVFSTVTEYYEVYIYSSEATELGGSDGFDDFNISLAAGWNVVIYVSSPDSSGYTNSIPSGISGAWTFEP